MAFIIYMFFLFLWCWFLIRKHQNSDNHSAFIKAITSALSSHKNATDTSSISFKTAITLIAVCSGLILAPIFPSLVVMNVIPLPDSLQVHTELTNHQEWLRITLLITAIGIGSLSCFLLAVTKKDFFQKPVLALILMGGFGLLVSGFLVSRELNILLDTSMPAIDQLPYTSKYCSVRCKYRSDRKPAEFKMAAKDCLQENREEAMKKKVQETFDGVLGLCKSRAYAAYTITVPHWNKADELYLIDVQPEVYDYAQKGDFIAIPKYAGALGIEWIKHGELQYIGSSYEK